MLVADLAGPGPGKGEIVTSLIQLWKAGKVTGTAAAELCGMPLSTFRYRAEIYQKAKLL